MALPNDFSDILEGLVMMYGGNIPYDAWESVGLDPVEVMESPEYISLVDSINEGDFGSTEMNDAPVMKRSPRLRGAVLQSEEDGFVPYNLGEYLDISVFSVATEEIDEDEDDYEEEDEDDILSEDVIHTATSESVGMTFATRLEGEKKVHIYL